ncbi:MAG: hypothetical protein PVH61_30095 [Candidatus Aminicenantes bacterium]|jgi:hypothetical protein
MIEKINGWLILTTCFFLLFLLATFLADRYRIQIQTFFEKHSWLSTKIPWNKVIKIGFTWVGILLLRKLIYYVSPHGVIQTKFSLWWVDNPVLIIIYSVPIGFLFGLPLLRLIRRIEKKSEARSNVIKIIIFIILISILNFFGRQNIPIERIFFTIVAAPFLLLKIVCPGKYIGLFTSLVLAYFIIEHHKKITTRIIKSRKRSKKFIFTSVLILLVLGGYIFITFPGHWEDRFQQKTQAAKSKRAVEDLLDAIATMNHESQRSFAIGVTAEKILETGDRQWQKETFPEVIAGVEKIDSRNRKFKLLEKIAFAVAKTGDIQWARSVAQKLPAFSTSTRALKKEILGKIERKND